jgi:putative transposase
MSWEALDLCLFVFLLVAILALLADGPARPVRCRRGGVPEPPTSGRRLCRPKEPWVRDAVLRLKALMPNLGCRKIADAFNGCYHGRESVGKTFVANTLRDHHQEILRLRREIRHRRPRALPRNRIWGLDLTYLPGRRNPVLGIIGHGTRACLLLEELHCKSALRVLRSLIAAARRFGLPHALRTDNEPCLCSLTIRLALRLLGVRHKAIDPHCPWQNGRIEKLFATFKGVALPRLADLRACQAEPDCFQPELRTFRLWYNHVRTHQHLGGLCPAEAWDGLKSAKQRPQARRHFFSAWEGLLTGFH